MFSYVCSFASLPLWFPGPRHEFLNRTVDTQVLASDSTTKPITASVISRESGCVEDISRQQWTRHSLLAHGKGCMSLVTCEGASRGFTAACHLDHTIRVIAFKRLFARQHHTDGLCLSHECLERLCPGLVVISCVESSYDMLASRFLCVLAFRVCQLLYVLCFKPRFPFTRVVAAFSCIFPLWSVSLTTLACRTVLATT